LQFKITNYMTLSRQSQKIITKTLGIKSMDDVMEMSFKRAPTPKNDAERGKAKKYFKRYRGSVRAVRGLFYTTEEFKNRREMILGAKLP